jgi:hypothetical protein
VTLETVTRGVLLGLGAAGLARGCYLVLFELPPRVWLPMLIWLAAGVVVHDVFLAPLSLLLGRILVRAIGRPVAIRVAGNALRGAWLGFGTVLLVGLPLLVGAGRRHNWTVIPGRPILNLFLSLALVSIGTGLVILRNLFTVTADSKPAAESAGPRLL